MAPITPSIVWAQDGDRTMGMGGGPGLTTGTSAAQAAIGASDARIAMYDVRPRARPEHVSLRGYGLKVACGVDCV